MMMPSRRFWVWGSFAVLCVAPAVAGAKALEARVDPRVELLSLIFRLAGNNEYNQPLSKSPYVDEVDAHFGKYREHAVVKLAAELRATRGVSYDAVMSLAVHLDDTESLKLRIPLDAPPPLLDKRWPHERMPEFLELARQFVQETGFNKFCAEHRKLYDATAERLAKRVNERDYVGWFDMFFGARPGARFCVLAGLLNGPGNYGSAIRFPDGREEITPVIGASKFDAAGIPVFEADAAGTIAHEFCHTYTNPFADKYADQLQPAAERIFKLCEAAMRDQAYGTWQTMMRESLVRACVVRYLQATDGEKAAQAEARDDEQRGFRWIGKLAELMGQYETQRAQYATFDTFMPRVVEFFTAYAKEYEKLMAKAPKVEKLVPANGARDVDPDLKEIKVYFDRPMQDRSWSVVGGGPHFPETAGDPHYDAAHKVLTIPVRLKPDWSYELWLNRNQYTGFRSAEGVELQSVAVKFKTRAK